MLQCVAVRCSQPHQAFRVVFRPPLACMMCRNVLQCFAVLCSALQYVAVWWSVSQCVAVHIIRILELCLVSRWPVCCVAMCCSALQCFAVLCSVLQCDEVCRSVLQCTSLGFWSCVSSPAGLYVSLQSVPVCCRELQSILSTCLHCVSSPTSPYDVVQCVSVCCSVLGCITVHIIMILEFRVVFHWPVWCVAVCCSVLQCVAVRCSQHQQDSSVVSRFPLAWCGAVYCKCCEKSVLEHVGACCSALQRVAACCSVLQRVAVCCSVLQTRPVRVPWLMCVYARHDSYASYDSRVAVCCSVLQCVAVTCSDLTHKSYHVYRRNSIYDFHALGKQNASLKY